MNEFDDIPRELAARDLPAGETILWSGKPDWRHLALDAFHAPLIAVYFVAVASWHLVAALHDGATRAVALADASAVIPPALLSLAIVGVLAWLSARSAVFTVTDRRIVMRFGIALPALVNIPLAHVEAVRLRRRFGTTGDLAFALPRKGRLAIHQLWPFCRPWRLFPADPTLRAIPGAAEVGAIVAAALRAVSEAEGVPVDHGAPVARPRTLPAAGAPEPRLEPSAA